MRTNAYLPQIVETGVGFYADGPNADPNAALFVRDGPTVRLKFCSLKKSETIVTVRGRIGV